MSFPAGKAISFLSWVITGTFVSKEKIVYVFSGISDKVRSYSIRAIAILVGSMFKRKNLKSAI